MATVARCLSHQTVQPIERAGVHLPRITAVTGYRLLVFLAAALYVVVLVRTAWLCEDSYIALRTVDNFVSGRGLTWNVVERVQTFTCPLWVLLVSAVYYFTREPFYTTIGVSLGCSLATVGVLTWHGLRRGAPVILALVILACSKAFADFSTSGLENPLTHLLLAAFLAVYVAVERPGLCRLGMLALLASLTAVNRLDTILFFAPPLALVWWQHRGWRAIAVTMLGFSPLAAWLGFAIFYYGFAFPNTAYAKLSAGIPAASLALQGFYYYVNSLAQDPVTLPCIGMALLTALATVARPVALVSSGRRVLGIELFQTADSPRYLAVALGILLYMAYIVRIGGDFMSGRFFAAPLLASCAILCSAPARWPRWLSAGLSAAVLLMGAWPDQGNLRSGADYGRPFVVEDVFHLHGVADERAFYYPGCGLLRTPGDNAYPFALLRQWGLQDRACAAQNPVVVCGNIGIRCFYGGPDVYYVDPLALSDALLARLPACDPEHCRIGHFERAMPNGYLETLTSGENRLEDPRLNVYYDRLRTVIRGDLFDRQRLREVVRMAKGRYRCLLADQPRVPPGRTTGPAN
jgi:arabinofuranosyltransferase